MASISSTYPGSHAVLCPSRSDATNTQTTNAWDEATAREQFRASFATGRGLGPESYSHPMNYADGQQRAKQALETLIGEHARLNPTQHLTRDRGMGISR